MKVAFDYQIFNLQKYGGISRYYSIISKELSKSGHSVKIFPGIHVNKYLASFDRALMCGSHISQYPRFTRRFFMRFNHHLTENKIAKWKPDIIHETYYSATSYKSLNIPKVATAHDMIYELYPDIFGENNKTTIAKKNTFERVDHIISVSQSTKNDLIEIFGVEENKVSVVHHGVDLDFGSIINNDIYFDKPFFLYVGHRGGYKNFIGMVEAVSKSNRLMSDFDIICFGGGHFSKVEKKIFSNLGYRQSQIKQLEGGDDILATLYKSASAFVYPSLYEGFGMPPLEAMVCKCPVISSNTSSMPEVIGNAGHYFNPSDLYSIYSSIENVVYSSSLSGHLIAKGVERSKLFSWDRCANETLNIYRGLLG